MGYSNPLNNLYMLSFSLFTLPFVPDSREGVCEADLINLATGIVCILAVCTVEMQSLMRY